MAELKMMQDTILNEIKKPKKPNTKDTALEPHVKEKFSQVWAKLKSKGLKKEKFNENCMQVAEHIKKYLDKKYEEDCHHVIVGKDYGLFCMHEKSKFLYLQYDDKDLECKIEIITFTAG